jgi:diguanylate cyclase (GGDEF)-like protein
MDRQSDGAGRLVLEVLALTAAMAFIVVIAAFHTFRGFGETAQAALGFSLTTLGLVTIPIQLFVVFRMGGLKRENLRLFSRATQDGLTQVLNKTTFRATVEAEVGSERRRRGDSLQHTLLIIDADHFKRINDRLGHATGDQALVAISRTLKRNVRSDDIVGRIGGEEFAILLKGAGIEDARIVAERLRLAVRQLSVGPRGRSVTLSVSIGGLSFANVVPYEVIYRVADANLYRAKKNGRNRSDLTSSVRPASVRPARREPGDRGTTAILASKAA